MALLRGTLISPSLRAELQTARVCAGLDKRIGWQAINKSKDANKLGGSHCTDLTAPRRSDQSLLKQRAQTTHPQMEGWEGKNV